MEASKKIDLLVIFLFLIFVSVTGILFFLKPLTLAFFYTIPISIYLSLRERKNFWKIFWAVIIFGAIFGFIFDFIQSFNEAWILTRSVIPWRVFGVLPVDDILGFMIMTLGIVIFYEHFLDDEKNRRISKNLLWALVPFSIILVFLVGVYLINPEFLRIPYPYLLGGLAAIIMPLALSLSKPRFLIKFIKLSAFFFIIWFVAEIICLKNMGWIFPGEYIGMIKIFGVVFPFEELFFWMFWYAATVVSYYEFFIDDKK